MCGGYTSAAAAVVALPAPATEATEATEAREAREATEATERRTAATTSRAKTVGAPGRHWCPCLLEAQSSNWQGKLATASGTCNGHATAMQRSVTAV